MNGTLAIIIGIAAVMLIMCLCDAVYKAIIIGSDKRKNEKARAKGVFDESAPESLANRFKK